MASFARSKGLVTYRGTLQDCRFPSAHFDAVFVWNCFEQIEEPHSILTEIKRVLKPGGLLLLRTPNALFYCVCQPFLAASPSGKLATWVRRALGYNDLLAFPYLYGYQSQTLVGIAETHGFQCAGKLNAEVITLTFPVISDWVLEEVCATRAALLEWSELDAFETSGQLTGPWIEVFYRAVRYFQ
jgi:SAM-dependent methyltransferase